MVLPLRTQPCIPAYRYSSVYSPPCEKWLSKCWPHNEGEQNCSIVNIAGVLAVFPVALQALKMLPIAFLCNGCAYYVPYSCLSISNKFCNGGERPEQGEQVLPPSVWALKPPSWALVHKTNYAPMIYTALCIMFWRRGYTVLGQVEGGWALEFSGFWAPNGTRLSAQCHFTEPKKLSNSRAQPLPLAFVRDMHASKTLCTTLYKS
jgi:hypothetical protein